MGHHSSVGLPTVDPRPNSCLPNIKVLYRQTMTGVQELLRLGPLSQAGTEMVRAARTRERLDPGRSARVIS
jgi:hypothetical protein